MGCSSQSALAFQENAKNLSAKLSAGCRGIGEAVSNFVGCTEPVYSGRRVSENRGNNGSHGGEGFVCVRRGTDCQAAGGNAGGVPIWSGGVLGSLAGSLGAALGSGGPQFGQGAGANDTGTVSPAVQANLDALKQSRTELQGPD